MILPHHRISKCQRNGNILTSSSIFVYREQSDQISSYHPFQTSSSRTSVNISSLHQHSISVSSSRILPQALLSFLYCHPVPIHLTVLRNTLKPRRNKLEKSHLDRVRDRRLRRWLRMESRLEVGSYFRIVTWLYLGWVVSKRFAKIYQPINHTETSDSGWHHIHPMLSQCLFCRMVSRWLTSLL